jgi:rRNA maturation endonuclease Nob1
MLKCEQCGDVYYTPELYQQCESCGGKLIDITPRKKEEKK